MASDQDRSPMLGKRIDPHDGNDKLLLGKRTVPGDISCVRDPRREAEFRELVAGIENEAPYRGPDIVLSTPPTAGELEAIVTRAVGRAAHLDHRGSELLRLRGLGLTKVVIAAKLGLSTDSISTYASNIYVGLGLSGLPHHRKLSVLQEVARRHFASDPEYQARAQC